MEQQVVKIMHGVPASGKTTFAKDFVSKDLTYKRLSRDDFRHMLDNYSFSSDLEHSITLMQNSALEHLLRAGFNVVLDNTHLRPKYIREAMKVIRGTGRNVSVHLHSFGDVPYEELLRRDEQRQNKVGKDVIDQMYKHLKANSVASLQKVIDEFPVIAPYELYIPDPYLPRAVICDIDGTLAHMTDRGPYDWNKVDTDVIDKNVRDVLGIFWQSYSHIILMSGRDEKAREKTEQWLFQHGIKYNHLFMRKEGDQRKDSIVKYELFNEHVRKNFNVKFVLDDRNQVVEMWREIGVTCWQVAPGDF